VSASGVRQAPAGATGTLVRPALPVDMIEVERLVNGYAAQNLMLPKTMAQLQRNFREFVVAEGEDGAFLGCGALRIFTPQLAEVVSLAVSPRAHGRGIGGRVVEQLVVEAEAIAIGAVFALTLRPTFFHRLGFRTVPKEIFPQKVWADCRTCPKVNACDEIAVVLEL